MTSSRLPVPVQRTLESYLTAEMSTFARSGFPVTWPVLPSFEPVSGRIAIVTSIGLPRKALNLRRDPRVSLLYSDGTGSGIADAATVQISGTATVGDDVVMRLKDVSDPLISAAFYDDAVELLRRQPAVGFYTRNRLVRYLMDWYFMRLLIIVQPATVRWKAESSDEWEVLHVA